MRDLFPIPRKANTHQGSGSMKELSRSQSVSRLSTFGELTVTPDIGGRYGISMMSAFVGDDSIASLSSDQKYDMANFSEFSEYAVAPEK